MLRNYIKVAVRHLLKNKTFSIINILGLSVGVACCVLLSLYIQDELSYEKHFKDHERVYRMYTNFIRDGKGQLFPRTSPPIAMELADVLPEIEIAARTVEIPNVDQYLIRYKDNVFFEKKGILADSTFFEVFPHEFEEGNGATALDEPSTVVISDRLSRKIFGDKSPLDELIAIDFGRSSDTFRITGVLKPTMNHSHTDVDFYMCMNSDGWGKFVLGQTTWAWNNFVSGYLKLKPGTHADEVDKKLVALLEQHAGADLKGAGLQKELHLQPLDDIRLYSDFSSSFGDMNNGSITYIYILSTIGVFILLIACINFMNLTTAKASQRASEVGIRKSMGAARSNLINQFLGESFTIVFVSLILSFLLILLALPLINQVTEKDLSINSTNGIFLLAAMLIVGGVTGLLAGSYPAFFLSSFQPADVLKNKNLSGDGSSILRRGLVVIQFIIAITLISSILIVHEQLTFIRQQPLGFNEGHTIMIPIRAASITDKIQTLQNEFGRVSGVKNVSAASSLPSTQMFGDFQLYTEGSTPDQGVLHRTVSVETDYFKVLDIKMLAGRDFVSPTDTFSNTFPNNKIMVNEASLKALNLKLEEAVGTKIYAIWSGVKRTHEIIAVIKDFHQYSLHQPISPMLFSLPADRQRFGMIAVSMDGQDNSATLTGLKSAWEKVVPDIPFESQFLSESVKKQYQSDDRIALMLTWSTVIAIMISCLGLYGLSIFVAERRNKEIGIRKVLGASVSGIVSMLSKEFIVLVMIAFAIAVPLGYYGMNQWLENFAFKIELGWFVFVLAGLISFLIAFLTVGFESIRAAMGNPVKALRSE